MSIAYSAKIDKTVTTTWEKRKDCRKTWRRRFSRRKGWPQRRRYPTWRHGREAVEVFAKITCSWWCCCRLNLFVLSSCSWRRISPSFSLSFSQDSYMHVFFFDSTTVNHLQCFRGRCKFFFALSSQESLLPIHHRFRMHPNCEMTFMLSCRREHALHLHWFARDWRQDDFFEKKKSPMAHKKRMEINLEMHVKKKRQHRADLTVKTSRR